MTTLPQSSAPVTKAARAEIRSLLMQGLMPDSLPESVTREVVIMLLDDLDRADQWVSDLQSGMYVNCVYCGHRYGPSDKVPATMADALKEHVERCPMHPMSKLKAVADAAKKMIAAKGRLWKCLDEFPDDQSCCSEYADHADQAVLDLEKTLADID